MEKIKICELSDKLGWKLVKKVTGAIAITLPQYYDELLICMEYGWFVYTINVLKDILISDKHFIIGANNGSINFAELAYTHSTKNMTMVHFYLGGSTDFLNSAQMTIYYK